MKVKSATVNKHKAKNAKDCAKYDVTIVYENDDGKQRTKKLSFGRRGKDTLNDYPHHRNKKRKSNYLTRHKHMGETWNHDGVLTRGFWSRHMLWSEIDAPKIEKHLNKVARPERKISFDASVRRALREPYEKC